MIFDDWEEKGKGIRIREKLFWECNMDAFDWYESRAFVMQRIVERGKMNDFYAAFRLYGGIESVREIIKDIRFLSDRNIAFVCAVFDLKKEELRCYIRKQWREKHLGSLEL